MSAATGTAILEPSSRRLVRIVGWLCLVSTFSVAAFLAGGPLTGRYEVLTVYSGSMQPAMSPGDAVVVVRTPTSSLRVGDILTYHVPTADHHVQTHRIVWLHHARGGLLVRTQGDGNARRDPWTARISSPSSWTVATVIPAAGTLLSAATIRGAAVLVCAFALMALIVLSVRRIWSDPIVAP
jgi:signal peptidase I